MLTAYVVLALAWFAPVLAAGKFIAPGDGLVDSIPNYLAPRTLWDPSLATGYPAAADPLTFTWYPPAILLSWIPGSYNAFVLSAFVLAAWFTYLLVFALTDSRFAAWISGLLYGFSGFLMAHAGHASMIHGAAWIPAVLLGIERLQPRRGWWWMFGCFSVANLVLAGQPQIMVYGLTLAGLYALARLRAWAPAMLACGIGLGAVLLVPLWELRAFTPREHVSYDTFNQYHLPARNLILLLFPYLYGGETGSIYGDRIAADTEQDAFFGLCALLLAAVAFLKRERGARLRLLPGFLPGFLLAAAAGALILALGGETIAGHVLYRVPMFNGFRCQARFLVLVQLSIALLAGFGIRAMLLDRNVRRLAVHVCAAMVLAEIAAAFVISQWSAKGLHAWAAKMGFPDASFDISTPALYVPLIAAGALLASVILFDRAGQRFAMAALSVAVIAELGSFGLFARWRYLSPDRKEIERPATASLVSDGRFATARGFLGKAAELPPNLSRIWGVESLGRDSPLAVEAYHKLVSMDAGGTLVGPWADDENHGLDLAGAKYVLTPDGDVGDMDRFQHVPMPQEELGEGLSSGGRRSASVRLQDARAFTELALVSFLSESFDIAQATPVMEMRLGDVAIPVAAGRETAELFADCPIIARRMRHQRAEVFRTIDAERFGQPCKAHYYFAKWPLPERSFDHIDLQWLAPGGAIEIVKLVLWNRQTGDIHVVEAPDFHGERFEWIATRERTRVYRNRRALPRARMDGGGTAEITDARNTSVEIRTHSANSSLLVLADIYYPGWQATVNGAPAEIGRTTEGQRAVAVPAGDNVVRFVYRPLSLYLGLGITLVSLVGSAGIALASLRLQPPFRTAHEAG